MRRLYEGITVPPNIVCIEKYVIMQTCTYLTPVVQVDSDASGQIDFAEFCELIHMMGTAYNPGEMKHMGHGAVGGPAGGLASSAQPPHVSALLSPNKQFSPTSPGKSAQERWARAIGGVSDRVLVKDTDDDMQLETVKDHEEEKK